MGMQKRVPSLNFISFVFLSVTLIFVTWNCLGLLSFSGFELRPFNYTKTQNKTIILHPKRGVINASTFSARSTAFFNSYPPCELRFLMTWISGLDTFSKREIISIQSVFKFHPQACLLILSSSMDSTAGAKLLKPFISLGFRVTSITPDFAHLLSRTPAKKWFRQLQRGRLDTGVVPLGQNLSNLLRLVALYKFGGIYLDTDVIIVKEFSGLKNVIGAQTTDLAGNWSRLNNAVLVFEQKHPLVYEFIREFSLTFNGNKWGHNGPYLVTRVVSRVREMKEFEYGVVPPSAFYPVMWNKIEGFFKRPRDKKYKKWVAAKLENIRRESFAVHLWNSWSRDMEVEKGSLIETIFASSCVHYNSSLSYQL